MTRFAGYAAVFDRVDRGGDVVRAGAFARSLARGFRGLPLLWQHRHGTPIGRIDYCREDKRGLRVIGRLSGCGAGAEAAALLKDGALDGLAERLEDPLKRWKLSPIDLEARRRYAAYTEAREAMLAATHSAHAPWTLVDFNDQKRGRLTLIRDLLDRVPDTELPAPALKLEPLKGKPKKERFGVLAPIADYPVD